jgi:small subunit ribosomal protein S5
LKTNKRLLYKPGTIKELELDDSVVDIGRTVKVVKGGRNFGFNALVAVGNRKGIVGIGLGKAKEVPAAIRKGIKKAKKNLIRVCLKEDRTLWHSVIGEKCGARILLKPAKPGTGIIAGGAARPVLELAGFKDVYAKSLRSNNPHNILKATVDGLLKVMTPEEVAEKRGKKLEEILEEK